ncbi:MAG: 5'/3'-nucleotidase SurE [Calditrichales bacterium]|nr:MAG: 5'/3'-nucleotidase SurE [Calditrichales bacterium]
MNILITNDDGIHAPGIFALKRALQSFADVIVVAPDTERSAVGHAITLSDPLRVTEVEKDGNFFGFAVNGTPADCVKLGIRCLAKAPVDIVVSGINMGPNTATNIIYSGTVSAAAEAVIMGVPGLAISLASFDVPEFEYACIIVRELVEKIIAHGLPEGTLINVNVPPVKPHEIKGIVITRQGKGRFEEFFDKRVDPNNRTYYWLTGKRMNIDSDEDVDEVVVRNNKVSITPVRYDLTDIKMLDQLKTWDIEK